MKSRIQRLFLLFVLLGGMLLAAPLRPARAAATCTVSNTNNMGLGSLRGCIGSAVDGDTVVVPGFITTITLNTFELLITKDITITGPANDKTSVSGGDAMRVFHIESGAIVSISGLIITHGKVTDANGGGIYNLGTLTLDHVAVSHSQAAVSAGAASGGGIANFGSLTITNSSITYNRANNMGAGLYNNFGSSLSMTNVSVENNQALDDTGSGGGLAIRGPNAGQTPAPVILDQLSITYNSAGDAGGGIFSDDSLAITDSLIAYNTANSGAGLKLTDEAAGTQPAVITITNTTLTQNVGYAGVGGLSISLSQAASAATLNTTTIARNLNEIAAPAGGITASGPGSTNVLNSIIAGNTSNSIPLDCGGTIHSQDYNLIQTTSGCTITGTTTHNITGVSAQLTFLADNGGPTRTLALPETSPALGAGNPAVPGSGGNACPSTDQRGVARPQALHCDMGAFEFEYELIFFQVFLPLVMK